MSDDVSLPQPTNTAINVVSTILDTLINGLGVDVAISLATTAEPWLASPFVSTLFKWIVDWVADYLEVNLVKIAVQLTIKIQSTELKQEYNDAIAPIIAGSPTAAEIQAARDAADAIIERNR